MADIEFESKTRISREQAGERLIALGKSLTAGARTELEREGNSIHFTVADELDWEFELNIDGDEVEIEIELKWSNRKPRARAKPAAPAASRAAARSEPRAHQQRQADRSVVRWGGDVGRSADDAVAAGGGDGVVTGCDVEFAVQGADVCLHRVRADAELAGDLRH